MKIELARLALIDSKLKTACWAVFAAIALGGCGGSKATPTAEANRLFLEAQQLTADGKVAEAKETLTASIAAEPTKWAYVELAKLNAQTDDVQAAADCEAALKIFPEDPDLLWLREELKKPKEKRFQGKAELPTSANR